MKLTWASQLVLLIACSVSVAQTNLQQQLNSILAFEKQNRFAEAIAIGQPLIDSHALQGEVLGRTLTLLGLAYVQEDRFRDGQTAFEQAIHIFENKPEYVLDYAAALHGFGELYQNMGQLDIACRLDERALRAYRQGGDHQSTVRVLSNLAGLLIGQNHLSEGRKYLKQADEESKTAAGLDEDDLATISAMQGWAALLQHNNAGAASYYQHSVELWKQRHGENHLLTGWGYILLGRAHVETGDKGKALDEMREGLRILALTAGAHSPKYFSAQLSYAYVLALNGFHEEAAKNKAEAEKGMKAYYQGRCANCTISAVALK